MLLPFDNKGVNVLRQVTPTGPSLAHACKGASAIACDAVVRGSPAGGRMRATTAAERKKRKESLDGGRTPSLCPRRHRRGTATMTPGISGEEAATVHRRGWEAVEHRAKAGRMRRITLPDGVGHLTNGAAWWGPLKPAVFLRERGDQGESSVFPLPLPPCPLPSPPSLSLTLWRGSVISRQSSHAHSSL